MSRDPLRAVLPLLEVRPWRVVRAVVLGALALGCSVGLAAVSAWLIARASQMPPVLSLSIAVVTVRACGVGRGVLRYLERLASHDVALGGMAALRANLYDALARGPVTGVVGLRRGDLLARVGADVDDVGDVVVRSLVPAGVAVVVGLGSVALVGALLPTAALALLGCLLLTGVLAPWLAARASAVTEARGAQARAEVTARTLAILEEGQQLRVAGRLDAELAALAAADERLTAAGDDGARTAGVSAAIGAAAQTLAVIAALWLGMGALQAGSLAEVELAVVVLTPLAVFEVTSVLPGAAVQLRRSREAAARLAALLPHTPTLSAPRVQRSRRTPDTSDDEARVSGPRGPGVRRAPDTSEEARVSGLQGPGVHRRADTSGSYAPVSGPRIPGVRRAPDTSGGGAPVSGPRGAGDRREADRRAGGEELLVLEGVSAGWPGAVAPAVDGVGLRLRAGSVVALAGPSGVGKTTLLMTAAGLLPACAGTVHGDATTLFLAEDGHVFDTTVLENLRVARGDVTPDDARAALDAVGLTTWLDGLPDGLDTALGGGATTMSGGERRRLLIARGLLSPARVLLVDEPAEHLDAAAADAVVAALAAHARATGRAVVVATHRLSAASGADEVLLLTPPDDGHAVPAPGGVAAPDNAASTGRAVDGRAGRAPAVVGARGTHADLLRDVPEYAWATRREDARAAGRDNADAGG